MADGQSWDTSLGQLIADGPRYNTHYQSPHSDGVLPYTS